MTRRETPSAAAARLAPPAPPCFSARDQWLEYVASSAIAHRQDHLPGPLLLEAGKPARFNPQFAFCADCSEAHSVRMWAAGKCQPRYLIVLLAEQADAATNTQEPAHD